jgi:drug/metabolite transporter (DMT)-like permease
VNVRLVPFALALLWGFNWPAVKLGLTEIPPFSLRGFGLGFGAALLFAFAALRGSVLTLPRPVWRDVAVGGLLSVAVFNLAATFSQLTTTTSRAAILTFTMPLWSALLARIVLGERIDGRKALALGIGAVGIGLLALPILAGDGSKWGLVFPLIAATGWAAGTIWQKRFPVAGDRIVITAWQLLVAMVCAWAGAALFGETPHLWPLSAPVAAAFVFHVIGAMAIAYVLWFSLLAQVSATVSALTTLMVPVVGVLSAMALVGDRPTSLDWVGFAAILLAAALVLVRFERP